MFLNEKLFLVQVDVHNGIGVGNCYLAIAVDLHGTTCNLHEVSALAEGC